MQTTTVDSPARSPQAQKRALSIIFMIMLLDVIGLSILGPVAPYIVRRYRDNASMVTLLTVIYAGAQFLAAPILGQISDRVGRRPVLLLSVLGSAIGYFIFGLGGALWVLLLSRLIDGLTGGNMSTAGAYIVDVSAPEQRAPNMTLIGMAFGLGFIIGPALGGLLGQWSVDLPLFAAGVLSLVSALAVYFWLPESLAPERRETGALRLADFNPLAAIGRFLGRPGLGLVLVVGALFNFGFDGANSTVGLYVIGKFAAQPWQIGALFVTVGLATAVVQAALVGRLVPRFGEKRMALVSLAGNAAGSLLFVAAPALWLLFPLGFLQAGVTGFIWATTGSLAAGYVSEREQGQLAGVSAALAGLMAMLGPLTAGAAYDAVSPAAPFWISLTVMLLGAVLLAWVRAAAPARARMAGA